MKVSGKDKSIDTDTVLIIPRLLRFRESHSEGGYPRADICI